MMSLPDDPTGISILRLCSSYTVAEAKRKSWAVAGIIGRPCPYLVAIGQGFRPCGACMNASMKSLSFV